MDIEAKTQSGTGYCSMSDEQRSMAVDALTKYAAAIGFVGKEREK